MRHFLFLCCLLFAAIGCGVSEEKVQEIFKKSREEEKKEDVKKLIEQVGSLSTKLDKLQEDQKKLATKDDVAKAEERAVAKAVEPLRKEQEAASNERKAAEKLRMELWQEVQKAIQKAIEDLKGKGIPKEEAKKEKKPYVSGSLKTLEQEKIEANAKLWDLYLQLHSWGQRDWLNNGMTLGVIKRANKRMATYKKHEAYYAHYFQQKEMGITPQMAIPVWPSQRDSKNHEAWQLMSELLPQKERGSGWERGERFLTGEDVDPALRKKVLGW